MTNTNENISHFCACGGWNLSVSFTRPLPEWCSSESLTLSNCILHLTPIYTRTPHTPQLQKVLIKHSTIANETSHTHTKRQRHTSNPIAMVLL